MNNIQRVTVNAGTPVEVDFGDIYSGNFRIKNFTASDVYASFDQTIPEDNNTIRIPKMWFDTLVSNEASSSSYYGYTNKLYIRSEADGSVEIQPLAYQFKPNSMFCRIFRKFRRNHA